MSNTQQAGFIPALVQGARAGYYAYRLARTGGPRGLAGAGGGRFGQYDLCWDAYTGALYDQFNPAYGAYLASNRLYGKTRQICGMVETSVDFYVSRVYPGVIDDQGVTSDARLQRGIPIVAGDKLKAAIFQIFQWSNWGRVLSEWITYGAATGDTSLDVIDDVENGRVYLDVRRPWEMREIDRDPRGHVVHSVAEWKAYDAELQKEISYRREWSLKEVIDTRDNRAVTTPNEYGFVPQVYTQHRFNPDIPGKPSFHNWRALDELNSIGSRLSDYIHKEAVSPKVFITAGEVEPILIDGKKQMEGDTITLLQMKSPNGSISDLKGNLSPSDAEKRIESLYAELRERNPEVTTFERLRSAGNISGVAVRRLLGDVEGNLSMASANYDSGLTNALRQAVAMAGQRLKEQQGGWASPTEQQRAFAGFDLESWKKGDLDFGIAPRLLVNDTDLERATTQTAVLTNLTTARVSQETIWREALGWDDARITKERQLLAAQGGAQSEPEEEIRTNVEE